jgi:hypothetical protein
MHAAVVHPARHGNGSDGRADSHRPAAQHSANFRVLGSGQGSVTTESILAELPELARQIINRAFRIDSVVVPLAHVEQAWNTPAEPGQRVVIVPA